MLLSVSAIRKEYFKKNHKSLMDNKGPLIYIAYTFSIEACIDVIKLSFLHTDRIHGLFNGF